MAARSRKILHDEDTRKKIQASQLINRLTQHALGTLDMSATQIRAAEILLDRSLPKLAAIELTGKDGDPIEIGFAIDPKELGRRAALLFTRAAEK